MHAVKLIAFCVVIASIYTCTIGDKPVPFRNLHQDEFMKMNIVNVQTHRAVGDGVTDDTAAIQAAIDAADAAGGGIVFFPAGTYKITSITLYNNVVLKGVNKNASILEGMAATGTMIVTGEGSRKWYICLRDIAIVATSYDTAVDWADVSHGEISNCIIGGGDYGIVLQNQAYCNQIIQTRVQGNEVGVRFKAGVDADDEPNTNFLFNLVVSGCKTGIHFESGWSGVNNLVVGGYFGVNKIAVRIQRYSQKILGLGGEGAGGNASSTPATTTYTATTVADSTSWDLSSAAAGMVALAGTGEYGVITNIDDDNDIVTVDAWYPSQPSDGTGVQISSAGIVLGSSLNSVIAPYLGGGFANGYFYIVDPGRQNTVLSAYQFSTNRIGAVEANQVPLTLSRIYSSGNPALLPILELVDEGGSGDHPRIIRGTIESDSDEDSEFIAFRKGTTYVFKVLRDGTLDIGSSIETGSSGAAAKDSEVASVDLINPGATGFDQSAGDLTLRAGWIKKATSNGYDAGKTYNAGTLYLGCGSAEDVNELGRVYGNISFRRYTDGGSTELMKIDGETGEMTLTGDLSAVGGFKQPFNFMQSNVAANQTAVAIDVLGLSGNTEIVMPYAGSVVGISIASNDARTAGMLTVDATVNGTVTGLQAQLDETNTEYHSATQPKDTSSFNTGDRLGVKITTDGSWAPNTADIVVTAIVEM